MKELKLDYSNRGKNTSKTKRLLMIAGFAMITLSLVTMVMVISQGFKIILLVAAIANTLVGVTFILQSVEHKIIYPKKFIHITTDSIEFKLGGWYKEQRIDWSTVRQITDKGKSVSVQCDDQVVRINMLHFPSSDEKQIKATLQAIFSTKQQ